MGTIKWQCNKCGKQVSSNTPPGQSSCPNGGNHVWGKLARFLKYLFEN